MPGGANAPTEKDPARSVACDLSAGKRNALCASFYFAGLKPRASTQEKNAPTCRGAKKTNREDAGLPGLNHRDAQFAKGPGATFKPEMRPPSRSKSDRDAQSAKARRYV